jgi:uncharacterized membrane protein YesL
MVQIAFVASHVFAILARFEMTVIRAIRCALYMSYRHLPTTVLSIASWIAIVSISVTIQVSFVFMMGIYAFYTSGLFIKMYRKHYPDFDQETDNDSYAERLLVLDGESSI